MGEKEWRELKALVGKTVKDIYGPDSFDGHITLYFEDGSTMSVNGSVEICPTTR